MACFAIARGSQRVRIYNSRRLDREASQRKKETCSYIQIRNSSVIFDNLNTRGENGGVLSGTNPALAALPLPKTADYSTLLTLFYSRTVAYKY